MVYLFLADGFEEVEAVVPIDLLRRAGVEVITVGVGSKKITGAHQITLIADWEEHELQDVRGAEGVILPGGPGRTNLRKSAVMRETVLQMARDGKMIAAICGAPELLGEMGLLEGVRATCFPGCEASCTGAIMQNTSVCRDGNIITSRGAGTALTFALEIVSYLKGKDAADKLAEEIQCAK